MDEPTSTFPELRLELVARNILFNVSLAKIKFDKVVSNPIVLKAWMEIFYFTPPEVSQIELYFVLEKATFKIIVVSSLRIL